MLDNDKISKYEYHSITPLLIIKGAKEAIAFYKKAFDAVEMISMLMPNEKIGYAEIKIGNSIVMLADEFPEMNGSPSPKSVGGSTVTIQLYVNDVDALVSQVIACGAKIIRPLQDQFFGDRSASLEDPFGHIWNIATRKEDISREEMLKRFNSMMKQS